MTTELWRRIVADMTVPTYSFGTRRAIPPSETLRRIRPRMGAAGITRLADVTGLDWIGLPVYQAIRPNSRTLSASQGKGLTRAQAQVSALMEALEGFHAEKIRQPRVRATVGSMRGRLGYDLRTLAVTQPALLTDSLVLDWLSATDLSTGASTWVPRQLCELDFCVRPRVHIPVFRASSNGLCSGNTPAEALIHGLCEVVERDSCRRHDRARFEPDRSIRLETVTTRLGQRLLDRFLRAGMDVQVVDMSGPTGLPCFEAWLDHPDGPALTRGSGCHPSRATALIRALTEAAQSRLTYIAGTRDDIPRSVYRTAVAGQQWSAFRSCACSAERDYRSVPTLSGGGFRTQLRDLVERIRAVTGMSPLAVDLTRHDFGVPILLVIAPGLGARPSI
jgi:ribosomal protein S12 methylthiotransferase accessory factor